MDIILQSIGRNGTKDISFTVDKNKMDDAIALLQQNTEKLGRFQHRLRRQRHQGVHCGRRHGDPSRRGRGDVRGAVLPRA